MIWYPEVLLVAGLLALYLYDSALLLSTNEALLIGRPRSGWIPAFGARHFLILGKEPFIPNPFLPHRPIYRFSWQLEGYVGPSRPWAAPKINYSALTAPIWLMGCALFILVPIGLFTRLGDLSIVAGITLFYVSALAALTTIWLKREEYRIDKHKFASMAFESLTCPPFALNLTRHLSLRIEQKRDYLTVLNECPSYQKRAAAIQAVISRIQNEIDWEDEGTARSHALSKHLKHLSSEVQPCQA